MYVYVLLITYVFNDVISVKNQRKLKKIMFEVRTCEVNDTACVFVEPVCQTISRYLHQNVKFRATKFTYCSCLSRQPNSMMSTSSSVYSISISMAQM